MKKLTWCSAGLLAFLGCETHDLQKDCDHSSKPNYVFFFCDDLGWGDLRCYNAESKIPTPNLDKLVAEGMIFNDAHTGSAVCTPSRYNVMTGRYCWRTSRKSGVGNGFSAPLIEPGRLTVAQMLKNDGYTTAMFGKWHLGWNWTLKSGTDKAAEATVDFSKPITNGPCDYGFDTYFGIPASLDMTPYVFIDNNLPTGIPTALSPKGKNAEARAREGLCLPGWKHENVLPELTARTVSFIGNQPADKPFFLYLPINGPHTPVVPNAQWIGKSGCGLYGDFIMEIDDAVGQIVAALKRRGQWENTVFVFTSDNGPETLTRNYIEKYDHQSSGIFRGWKRHNWEGGHRVPYIVTWPAKVKAGSRCDRLIEVGDFMATAAAISDIDVPENAAEDSLSFLPYLLGNSDVTCRKTAIHHSANGLFAIRGGDWKLIFHPGGDANSGLEIKSVQLYNIKDDPSETKNLAEQHPNIVKRLHARCLRGIDDGRSSPGKPQPQMMQNWPQRKNLKAYRP